MIHEGVLKVPCKSSIKILGKYLIAYSCFQFQVRENPHHLTIGSLCDFYNKKNDTGNKVLNLRHEVMNHPLQ
jgi:hypothetical protein